MYLSAFSLVIRMMLTGRKKKAAAQPVPAVPAEPLPDEPDIPEAEAEEKGGVEK